MAVRKRLLDLVCKSFQSSDNITSMLSQYLFGLMTGYQHFVYLHMENKNSVFRKTLTKERQYLIQYLQLILCLLFLRAPSVVLALWLIFRPLLCYAYPRICLPPKMNLILIHLLQAPGQVYILLIYQPRIIPFLPHSL